MSLFGPVTTAEIRGWQCAAGLLLHELLDRAHCDQLPPVAWTLSSLGGLVARCATTDEWNAWLAALHLTDVRPRVVYRNHVRLRATGAVSTSRGRRVTVVLLADLDDNHDAGEHEDPPRDAA